MGVIRVEHNSNYTVMSNEHLRDPRLSLRAMGLMSKMLSDSETYRHSVAGLAAVCKEGRDAVRKALQELEAAGYLVREQTREGGSFGSCDYTLYEHSRSPLTENPTTGNPSTENPTTKNPTQRNTKREEVTRKEPPIAPQGAGVDYVPKQAPDWKPERFQGFWEFYPLHKSKQAAIRAWDKLKPSDELLAVIGKALKRQIAEAQAEAQRQRRPYEWKLYASTYLNGARWTDDPNEASELYEAPERRLAGERC